MTIAVKGTTSRTLRKESASWASVNDLPIGGFIRQIVCYLMNFFDVCDDFLLVGFEFIVTIVTEAGALLVRSFVDRSSFFHPLEYSAIHDSDIKTAEISEHPGSTCNSSHSLHVVADNLIVPVDSDFAHMLSEEGG